MLVRAVPATAQVQDATALPFLVQRNDIVVFTGGGNMVAAQQAAHLETLFTLSFARTNLHFRSLAWEGDTVYEQRREMNFGFWQDQLKRVGATIIFAQFGQMESLQGAASVAQFARAYEKLLEQFARQTQRIVLVSPAPFEKPEPPLPDLSVRNNDLRLYVDAIRDLARRHQYRFVDLFTPFQALARNGLHLTSDGFQLAPAGHWAMATEIARQLGISRSNPRVQVNPATGAMQPDSVERLRQAVQAKNGLWFNYWRPMNWAFLRGDRIEQPSSRDHRNPAIRWFPEEMEKFLPLIEAKEKEIAGLATHK